MLYDIHTFKLLHICSVHVCGMHAVGLSVMLHALPTVRVRWNGLNRSVEQTVLHTSHRAMLAAVISSHTTSVIYCRRVCYELNVHCFLHKLVTKEKISYRPHPSGVL